MGVLMVVMGGKYTDVRGNNYGLVSIFYVSKIKKSFFNLTPSPLRKVISSN